MLTTTATVKTIDSQRWVCRTHVPSAPDGGLDFVLATGDGIIA
jgi:hypothetical protein